MKYFAKYLPAEGEIKEGDTIKDLVSGDIGIVKKWEKHINEQDDYKKVKLFLCTHDMEGVIGGDGTKVYLPHDPKHKNEEKPFRVLGEISKNALWVKENDEFSEEKVKHNHICHDSWGNTGYCFHCQRSKGCDSKDYNYLIKGPCGHFH